MPRLGLLGIVSCVIGCAAPQRRTIEPESSAESQPADESSFVLSRKPTGHAENQSLLPVHTGELWWGFRGAFLELSESQVRQRDEAISEHEAPDNFWDTQTAVESISLWTSLCNECHGGRRRVEDALSMPAPPAGWGRGEGQFFGKMRPYTEVFATVYQGGPTRKGKRSEMPPWRGKIAREQIWAVLYFLAYQSGGIDGPVPPSLRPRQSAEIRRILDSPGAPPSK